MRTKTHKLIDLVLGLPTKNRTLDEVQIDKSLENISKASFIAWKEARAALQTEVIGESAALLKMINQKDMHLACPINPGHGAGIDQLWYKKSGQAAIAEYHIIEAKGPSAKLSSNRWSTIGEQMSPDWVKTRIDRMIPSSDRTIQKYGKRLRNAMKNKIPIYGLTVQAKWDDDNGKLGYTHTKKKQFNFEHALV